jgi:hypothetical protein
VGSDLPLTLAWSRIHGPLRLTRYPDYEPADSVAPSPLWGCRPRTTTFSDTAVPFAPPPHPPKGARERERAVPRGRPLQAGEDCTLEATPTALSSSVSTTRILAVIEALCQPSKHLLGMYIYASVALGPSPSPAPGARASDCYPAFPPRPPLKGGLEWGTTGYRSHLV